jgi:thiol-disulfide isomerase/thioredoxin
MVGKPAPALPKSGWIGLPPPDLTGKPYLLHFWATWCGPCKNDLPRLKALAERGATIRGMHPSETSREEVEEFLREQQRGYPTFLAADKNDDPTRPKIGGYTAGVFPYCILVNTQGRVAGHGALSEVLTKFGVQMLITSPKDDGKKYRKGGYSYWPCPFGLSAASLIDDLSRGRPSRPRRRTTSASDRPATVIREGKVSGHTYPLARAEQMRGDLEGPVREPGKEATLPPPPPLRTARESFPSGSSSLHERPSRDAVAFVRPSCTWI